jgi:hypothetical protein
MKHKGTVMTDTRRNGQTAKKYEPELLVMLYLG